MKSVLCICLSFLTQITFSAAKIEADKTSGCSPVQVSFKGVSETNGGTWNWDFGNGSTSSRQNPSVVFVQPGVYTVKLNTGNETSTVNITVFASPNADFTTDKTKACVTDGVNFTDKSTGTAPIVNYVWAFGDGKTLTGDKMQTTAHVYKNSGVYDVSLLVTDANGCVSTKTTYSSIEAAAKPVAAFKTSVNSSCNETEQISFANQSTGNNKLNYTWNFGDKQTSAEMNPSHVFTQGKYDVSLEVKDENGCSNTATQKVSVTKLKADFIAEKEQACTGERLKFVNTSNFKGSKWAWEFGDGTASTESNPEKAFAKAGTYSVKFTVTEGECSQTVSRNAYVTVRNGINTTFTSDASSSCAEPVTVKLKNNTPNSAVVLWNFGDGTVSTKNEAEKVYSAAGNYKVSLEVTDSSGCTVKKESEKVIHALKPLVGFKGDTFACAGYQVKFVNFTPNAASYLWNFGDGETSTQKNPFHVYKKNGNYDVSLTAYGDGCDSTISFKNYVHVDELKVDFEMSASSQTLVPPFLFSFKNKTNNPNLKYMWDFGDGYTEASVNPVHIYNTPGNFNVRLIAYAKNGCTNSKTVSNNIQMGTSMGSGADFE